MKKILAVVMCFGALLSRGQDLDIPTDFTVNEQMYMLNEAQQNAFVVEVQGEAKEVKKSFKDFLEKRFAIEVKGMGSTLKGEALSNSRISDKVFNLTVKLEENGAMNRVVIFTQFTNGEFASSEKYGPEAAALKNLLSDFTKSFYADEVNERIAVKTEELEKLNKAREKDIDEQTDLAKSIAKNEKNIAKSESKIAKAQLKIEKYQEKIKAEEEALAESGQEVESVKAEIEKTAAKKQEVETELEQNNKLIEQKSQELKNLQAKLSKLLSF